MALRQPSPKERVVLWRWIANAIVVGGQSAALLVIWAVMPVVPTVDQLLIAIFVVTCIPTQIIFSPESSTAIRGGTVAVLGSLAAFLASRPSRIEHLAAVYAVGFGVAMFVGSNALNKIVNEMVAARLASDAAAVKLDRMLVEVAAQRDARTKFIASASHDLGQPLQAVALFFDQCVRAPAGPTRDAAIDGVRNGLLAADGLLSHMLGHLRLEADAVEPHRTSVDVRNVLRRVAARHTLSALNAGMTLRVAAQPLVLALDPTLLDRALGNLIANALTHSRGRHILLLARRHGLSAARIWVLDDGVGVNRVDANHIFDDYYQGSPEGGGVREGFGLGLASARRIAVLMNGEVGLDQRWRTGAAFYLQFPMHQRIEHRRARLAS